MVLFRSAALPGPIGASNQNGERDSRLHGTVGRRVAQAWPRPRIRDWHSTRLGTRSTAKLGHGPEFQKRIQATFGSQPEFQYFETPIIIDNTTN